MMNISVFVLSLCAVVILGDMIEYDGTYLVKLKEEEDNWALKYPLGPVCPDNWKITITIEAKSTTSEYESDLVLAFGTNDEYVIAALSYDGIVHIWDLDNDGQKEKKKRSGDGLIAPPSGSDFIDNNGPTDDCYIWQSKDARKNNGRDYRVSWREQCVPNQNKRKFWEILFDAKSGADKNKSPVVIEIKQNVNTGRTSFTFTKNGESSSVQYKDTFEIGEELFVWVAADNLSKEGFKIESITSTNTAGNCEMPEFIGDLCEVECPEGTEQIGSDNADIRTVLQSFEYKDGPTWCSLKCEQFNKCKAFSYSPETQKCKLFETDKADSECAEEQVLCTRPCESLMAQSAFQLFDGESANTATDVWFGMSMQHMLYLLALLLVLNVAYMTISCVQNMKNKAGYAVVSVHSDIEK